jgi:hypothetical protein
MDSFPELAKLSKEVPDGTPLLATLAARFEAVGMHEEVGERASRKKQTVVYLSANKIIYLFITHTK